MEIMRSHGTLDLVQSATPPEPTRDAPGPAPETGLHVVNLEQDVAFAARTIRGRDSAAQTQALLRIASAFVEEPATILQELVNAAITLCGADSAGISVEKEDATDTEFYKWVATAGDYSGFLNATLPRYPSACGVCLERGQPQLFRVDQAFFDLLGVEAPLVSDGILLPWHVEEARGTIFIMAHSRAEAFDRQDCRAMQMLADFAALGVRQQGQQRKLLQQARSSASAAMAHRLAHEINNPLQSLTNTLYLATEGHFGPDARALGSATLGDLTKLSALVRDLLALPSS